MCRLGKSPRASVNYLSNTGVRFTTDNASGSSSSKPIESYFVDALHNETGEEGMVIYNVGKRTREKDSAGSSNVAAGRTSRKRVQSTYVQPTTAVPPHILPSSVAPGLDVSVTNNNPMVSTREDTTRLQAVMIELYYLIRNR